MKVLYLMIGPPGCGKSTYIMNTKRQTSAWVSRDNIRKLICASIDGYFSADNYFKHENKVFEVFVKTIREALIDENITEVYADATHINEASRRRLLLKLDLKDVEVIPIFFKTPLDVCLVQNAKREGVARVPDSVVCDMYRRTTHPKNDKFLSYSTYLEV